MFTFEKFTAMPKVVLCLVVLIALCFNFCLMSLVSTRDACVFAYTITCACLHSYMIVYIAAVMKFSAEKFRIN